MRPLLLAFVFCGQFSTFRNDDNILYFRNINQHLLSRSIRIETSSAVILILARWSRAQFPLVFWWYFFLKRLDTIKNFCNIFSDSVTITPLKKKTFQEVNYFSKENSQKKNSQNIFMSQQLDVKYTIRRNALNHGRHIKIGCWRSLDHFLFMCNRLLFHVIYRASLTAKIFSYLYPKVLISAFGKLEKIISTV